MQAGTAAALERLITDVSTEELRRRPAPDRTWGQRIVAAVVLEASDPRPSPEDLLEELSDFCGRSLADYKRPREVRVLEELPRNALGKVQKHRLLD